MEGTTWEDAIVEVVVTLMVEGDTLEHVDKSHKLIRTITNFRFVSRDNPTEMVSVGVGPAPVKDKKAQVHLIGLVASANLEFEMGQRAQAGLWWVNEDILKKRPFHMVFMKIPVHEIQVYAPTWWRDGKTLAVVVWGSRGVYVLQGADLQYHHRYALCTLDPLVHAMRPVNFLTLPARPSWIDAPFFENMKHDYRLGSQLHPENMAPPPLPKITTPEQKRLRLEGDIASRQCTTRVLNQEIKALLADKEKVAASKIKPAEKKRVLQEYSTEIQAIKEEVQVNKAFLGDLDRKLADLVKLGKKKQAVSKKVKDKGKANGNSTGPGAKSKDVELVNIAQADPQSSAIEHTTAPIPKSISTALSPPEVAPEPAPSPVPDSAPEAVSGPAPMDVDDAIEDTAPLVVIEDLPPPVEDPAPPVAQAASSQSQMQVPGPSSAAEISQLLGVHPGTSQGADIPIDPALLNEEQLGLFRALHESTPPMGGQVPGYGWGGFFMPNIPPP
ncbi:unnamed protein product [Rhizoctonia solani]|uniref:Uncharacterized protein n=1 Tax=Rhizoctonia solani TaxID=456999 RepID=A0A8H3ACY5_9AGAM|nr:unnamed protein product [Rhizoctonia solani]